MPQTKPTLFVSHATEDQALIECFGDFLISLSLKQIQIWFSSDKTSQGGLKPGDIWFEQIQGKMASSAAVLVVLTKNSVQKPWLYFESGYGLAQQNRTLIIVTHGISSLSEISPPFSFWQMYRIDTAEGLHEFSEKLLQLYDIAFDGILFDAYSKRFLEQVSKLGNFNSLVRKKHELQLDGRSMTDAQKIIDHFDRRFFELTTSTQGRVPYMSYQVNIINEFSKENFRLEIYNGMNLQEAMDTVWFEIQKFVRPYTYLEKWIMKHKRTGHSLVIREIFFSIAATEIFKPEAIWQVIPLNKPYTATDSPPEDELRNLGLG